MDVRGGFERSLCELSEEEVGKVRLEVVKEVIGVEVVGVWRDDHCPCVGVRVGGVEFGFWCLTDVAAGAFHYSDSVSAQVVIRELIVDGLGDWVKENKGE